MEHDQLVTVGTSRLQNPKTNLLSLSRGIHDNNHIIEEPYEMKVSRTVLETSLLGD